MIAVCNLDHDNNFFIVKLRRNEMRWLIAVVAFANIVTSVHASQKAAKYSPDNSSANQRILDANGLTAQNQSNTGKDIDVTARIRKELVSDKSLSTYAKNVKIIVLENGITLKGPVNTVAERDRIVNVAYGIAPQMKIYNQMTVIK
jgi:hyperosmotically inducible protein